MKTRIIVERLIGENSHTYFLDIFDEERMEWKNHSSYRSLNMAEQQISQLLNSNNVEEIK